MITKTKHRIQHEEPPIKFSLYLPEPLAQRVAASADQQRLSRNLLVNQILCDWFMKQDEYSAKSNDTTKQKLEDMGITEKGQK